VDHHFALSHSASVLLPNLKRNRRVLMGRHLATAGPMDSILPLTCTRNGPTLAGSWTTTWASPTLPATLMVSRQECAC